MTMPLTTLILLSSLVLSPQVAGQQGGGSPLFSWDASMIRKLPPALQEQGLAVLKTGDDAVRAELVRGLARNHFPAAGEFLLSLLESDSSDQVRREILSEAGKRSDARVQAALAEVISNDPDPELSLSALEALRRQKMEELQTLLVQRMDLARKNDDQAALQLLAEEQERWISLVRGTMLPSFLRAVPPVFRVKEADQPVRVVAFGDYGRGSERQRAVASALQSYQAGKPFDFGITLGDNFYTHGMYSTEDPRWKTWWEEMYAPLKIPFYATMGNHDWLHPDSPAAEILYSRLSDSWRMPAPYYTFTAGSVQFFAVDTNELSEAQLMWLDRELEASRSPWKVVYGHHPAFSEGAHRDNPRIISQLLPVLRGRAQVYLAGHDHDLQHLRPEDGVHFFVSGGGGTPIRPIEPGPRSLFALSSYGFAVLETEQDRLRVRFLNEKLETLYEYELPPPQSTH